MILMTGATGHLDKPEAPTVAMQGADQLFFVMRITARLENLLRAAKQARVRQMLRGK